MGGLKNKTTLFSSTLKVRKRKLSLLFLFVAPFMSYECFLIISFFLATRFHIAQLLYKKTNVDYQNQSQVLQENQLEAYKIIP
jgi:hypothetical protein